MNTTLSLILSPALKSLGFELVGCRLRSVGKRGQLLQVFIDKLDRSTGGISIEDCVRASHQIKGILEVENCVPGDYRLEVSSAGIDRANLVFEN